ncbi:hypothetical protein IQ268_10985 [Oculatella sp. LEGE 06141]|uniref:hypothetical protein n=1 Tax=Oculatella sp. LEGE 06141 TaxID=1828648 RepID=UPI001882753F|nr:hypothetical protein [Oculatella sp. LEGE 06141]MBE9179086.1 hypothetical protein [Oculatella sp. LEGE 06141]
MKLVLSALKKALYKGIYVGALVALLNIGGWLAIATPASYAASTTVQDQESVESREQAYEEAKSIVNDPKGIEREYEKNKDAYLKEHPEEGGVIEEAKQAVERITGND